MSTTNLFVELVVIGVGAFAWVLLLLLSVFGWHWVPLEQVFSSTALIPLIALIYLLGIITDRIADTIFERAWSHRLRSAMFTTSSDYHADRHEVLLGSDRLAELIEYGRSRLRICRGWALNGVLLAAALNVMVAVHLRDADDAWRVSLFGTTFFLAVAWGAWYSWRKLSSTEYQKIREQAALIRRRSQGPDQTSSGTTPASA